MSAVSFMPIVELKRLLNVTKLVVVRNPKTSKLFVASPEGLFTLRCEQDLDITKPMSYIRDEGAELHEGCIINVKPNVDNVVAEL